MDFRQIHYFISLYEEGTVTRAAYRLTQQRGSDPGLPSLGLALVLPSRGHGLRSNIESFAESENIELNPKFDIDSPVATIRLVEQTRVATIVPRIAVHRQLSSGALRAYPIVSPRLVRRVVSVSHPRRPLNPATKLFISMLGANLRLRTPGNGLEGDTPAVPEE